jgi:RimJ/RimL family protein N-acetyltransferase
MTLQTPRLHLRDYRPEDWERVHIYGKDPVFSQYEAWGPNTPEDTKKFVADMVAQAQTQSQPQTHPRHKFDLAICLKDQDLLIGGCGIRREAPESAIANLGWAVNPEFQSKGYATEAARALIEFGFAKLGLSVIYATCDAKNTASYKVMEKLGMKRVGLLEKEREQKGAKRDTLRYEIVKTP